MLKYFNWPRGEEETRLSAKQLCASPILAVASAINKTTKILTILAVIAGFIGTLVVKSVRA